MATSLVPDDAAEGLSVVVDPEGVDGMKRVRVDTYRSKRADSQRAVAARSKATTGDFAEIAMEAAGSSQLADSTNEELADMIINRMAKIQLLGGKPYMPVTVKECSDIAHTWSVIAKNESIRKGKVKPDVVEKNTPTQEVAKAMSQMARRLRVVQGRGA